jgi:osmotically inducible protein OsmC
MAVRNAKASWEGALKSGKGSLQLGSGRYEDSYSFLSRFEEGEGTNPEELIAAAEAGCFSMALSHILAEAGYSSERIDTTAAVQLDRVEEGFRISRVKVETIARVAGIQEDDFQGYARKALEECPVSKALGSVKKELAATLQS